MHGHLSSIPAFLLSMLLPLAVHSAWKPAFLVRSRRMVRTVQALSSSSSGHKVAPPGECPLRFETLPYSGAEIRMPDEDSDDKDFLEMLSSSIDYWKKNDYNSAWIRVPVGKASIIEDLTRKSDDNLGFEFDVHHTNVTEQTIVLKKWLKAEKEDKIPPFATHQVGCAGFVLNEQNEILVIREWTGPPSNRTPTKQWKLPGGLLDAGESFEEATCREVQEETGIPCEFEGILTFWHRHGLTFGKSDLYFVCMLKPKSLSIAVDPVEVSEATWMSVDEFVKTQDHPLIKHVLRSGFCVDGSKEVGNTVRMVPSTAITKGTIQWPNRPEIPTYTSYASSKKG